MKRIIVGLVCGATLLSLAPAAAGAIKIAKIRYNPPGADTGSSASLRAEWITIKNTGNSARQLNGWRVRDRAGHAFRIGSLALPGGETVKIHTGSGADSFPHHLYWGLDNYVWNNDRDKATLKKPNDTVADTCSYNNPSASSKVC